MGALADLLLRWDHSRQDMLHDLEMKHTLAFEAMQEYREAFKVARKVGWAKADLVRVGFLDPTRLPHKPQPKRASRRNTEVRDSGEDNHT